MMHRRWAVDLWIQTHSAMDRWWTAQTTRRPPSVHSLVNRVWLHRVHSPDGRSEFHVQSQSTATPSAPAHAAQGSLWAASLQHQIRWRIGPQASSVEDPPRTRKRQNSSESWSGRFRNISPGPKTAGATHGAALRCAINKRIDLVDVPHSVDDISHPTVRLFSLGRIS